MAKQYIPRDSSRKAKRKSAGVSVSALAVCLVLLTILTGVVIGRYQTQIKSDGSVRAQEFYFISNLLDGGTYTLAPGSTNVSFTLGNHADQLRVSEMDISYELRVEPAAGVTVTYGNADKKLSKGAVQDDTVTIENLQSGVTYTVSATGTGGYKETLTAKIVVPVQAARIYKHQGNFAEYTLLTVWNEGEEAGKVTVEYSGIPDNTNPNMADWTTGGNKEITIAPP